MKSWIYLNSDQFRIVSPIHKDVNKDNEYLSTKIQISDLDFARWNGQMFRYDKNSSDLVLRRGFTFACDVPKKIRNVVNVGNIRNKRIYV